MSENVIAEVVFDLAAYSYQNPPHPEAEESLNDRDTHYQSCINGQLPGLKRLPEAVHRILENLWRKHGGYNGQNDHEKAKDHPGAVAAKVRYQVKKGIFPYIF